MSLTPDPYFNGNSTCLCCDKPMFANDAGIVYRPYKREDFLFCVGCATQMTMSIAQDITKVHGGPDIALSYYFKFSDLEASASNLRRHADGLKKLAEMMESQADSLAYMHHPDEDKAE